jgi:GMP synthase (glutamine-hydrolysing)
VAIEAGFAYTRNMSGAILLVLHEQLEDTGHVERALRQTDYTPVELRPYLGQEAPADLRPYRGIVVMGGLTSVRHQEQIPYLREELRLLRTALALELPVLGICLGSQLLAAALGAYVFPARRREAGWFEVSLTQAGVADPLFAELPPRFTALHWHSDNFMLPPDCEHLATSQLTDYQAFRHGRATYGLLFHLEPDRQLFDVMLRQAQRSGYINPSAAELIERQSAEFLPLLEHDAPRVFGAWLGLLAG